MSHPEPSSRVNVDVTNPGQFFACCGLLELAHQLWPGAEGWFDASSATFVVCSGDNSPTLEHLQHELSKCEILGLSDEERLEREALEAESRQFKRQNKKLSNEKEERRKELGGIARAGAILFGEPFRFVLNWWRVDDEDIRTPKTWAGLQEIHKVARAAQDALSDIGEPEKLFDHGRVLRMPLEYRKKKSDDKKPVEPFYFDARRFAHALDTGFSLDAQDAEAVAYPAVELLSLIGLQRFRPSTTSRRFVFEYSIWTVPLSAPVAGAAACRALHAGQGYRFQLLFRDDQKRYKAFDFATPIGDQR